jgi:hypothetical protein
MKSLSTSGKPEKEPVPADCSDDALILLFLKKFPEAIARRPRVCLLSFSLLHFTLLDLKIQ